LKWNLVTCCDDLTPMQCVLNNLATEQLLISVLCIFILYILAVIFYPEKSEDKYSKPSRFAILQTKKAAWIIFFLAQFLGILMSVIAGVLYYNFKFSGTTLQRYANSLGGISSIGMILQWAPQIFTTIKSKSAGNLSLIMLCIQMPGALLVVFFQGFLNHASYTTWGPYIFSALEMAFLIILILIYWLRDKHGKSKNELEPLLHSTDKTY